MFSDEGDSYAKCQRACWRVGPNLALLANLVALTFLLFAAMGGSWSRVTITQQQVFRDSAQNPNAAWIASKATIYYGLSSVHVYPSGPHAASGSQTYSYGDSIISSGSWLNELGGMIVVFVTSATALTMASTALCVCVHPLRIHQRFWLYGLGTHALQVFMLLLCILIWGMEAHSIVRNTFPDGSHGKGGSFVSLIVAFLSSIVASVAYITGLRVSLLEFFGVQTSKESSRRGGRRSFAPSGGVSSVSSGALSDTEWTSASSQESWGHYLKRQLLRVGSLGGSSSAGRDMGSSMRDVQADYGYSADDDEDVHSALIVEDDEEV